MNADVVVVGGGIAGLVAARECARVGLAVAVIEQNETVGGCVGSVTLDVGIDGAPVTLDTGAEGFAVRGDHVATLLTDLGLGEEIASPNPAGAWLYLVDGRAVPMPRTGVLGIPATPLADDVRAVIGWRGAWRAYLDRVMPILKIGREVNLGELVRKRMGQSVLDNLVAPISAGVYSADPNLLDVDLVAPGLNQKMTQAGSLSGGVSMLAENRPAGGAVRGLVGGMNRFAAALRADLEKLDVSFITGARVDALEKTDDETPGWRIRSEAFSDGSDEPEELVVDAENLILAVPASAALRLLHGAEPDRDEFAEEWADGAPIEIATLVLDVPALDAAPRGTGLLVVPGAPGVTAKALTHSSAKWSWLAELLPPGRHVVRLSYGRAGAPDETHALSDEALADLARGDASVLLGVPIDAEQVVAFARTSWHDAASHALLGRREKVDALRAAIEADPSLGAAGSWLAGTGLASVIPDAKEAGLRIRHHGLGLDLPV